MPKRRSPPPSTSYARADEAVPSTLEIAMELPIASVSLRMCTLNKKLFKQIRTVTYAELMPHLKAHKEARSADPTAQTSLICKIDGDVTDDSGWWLIMHTGDNVYGKFLVMGETVQDVRQVYLI
jgi:hypothetical protein